jgi:hypothetical protein
MEFDITGEIKLAPGGLVIPIKQKWQFPQLKQDKPLVCEIREKKEKRSLNANSYAWQLIGQMADIMRASKEDVYIQMLERYGQREPELIWVISEAAPMIYKATRNHCTQVGETEKQGKAYKHLAILIGSSEYDTKQMSILIDGIVSEAKELGIETLTPDELAKIKAEWNRS